MGTHVLAALHRFPKPLFVVKAALTCVWLETSKSAGDFSIEKITSCPTKALFQYESLRLLYRHHLSPWLGDKEAVMFQTVTHLPHIHCLIQFFKGNFKCSFQNVSLLCCDHIEIWWKISELLPHSSKGNISENITEIKINLCNNDNLAPLMGPVCFTNSVLFCMIILQKIFCPLCLDMRTG